MKMQNGYPLAPNQPKWVVTDVEPQDDYVLLVTFVTNEKKAYDCKPLLESGVFKQLKNPQIFHLAHAEDGTVVWNEDLDIAPETLYADGVKA